MLIKNIIYLCLLWFLTACGGSASNSTEEDVILTFTKPSINLPIKLEENRELLTRDSTKSYSYETIQSNLLSYREQSREIAFNLGLIEKVMPEIQTLCKGFDIDENCTIEAKTLSIFLTKPELRVIKKRYTQLDIDFDVNNSLSFGEISFVKHSNENSYKYELHASMLSIYDDIMGKVKEAFYERKYLKNIHSIYWSEDNKSIHVSHEDESNNSIEKIRFDYLHTKDKQDIVHLYTYAKFISYYIDSNPIYEESRENLTFRNTHDENETYVVKSNGYKLKYAHISNKIGFNIEKDKENSGASISFFNNEGYELGQYGCSSYSDCDVADKSTWLDEYSGEHELNATIIDEKLQVYAKKILDENSSLENGEYFLLPLDNVNEIQSKEDVLTKSVGEFMVEEGKAIGLLYDETYSNRLDELIVYRGLSDNLNKVEYEAIAIEK